MFLKYLFMFSLFSFVGWVLELFYRGIRNKKVLNPGFMNGCVVPLYGAGAVLSDIICNTFRHVNSNYNAILTFVTAVIILSILEFITGFILDKVFHMRLWAYSKYKLNIKGYICMQYSIMWGLLFLIYSNLLYSNIDSMSNSFINNQVSVFFLGLFYGVFLIDLSVSIGLTSNVIRYSKILAESINLEKLREDLKKRVEKRKFIYSIFPYATTNKYLKDKIKEK